MEEYGVYTYDVDARLTKTQIKLLFNHVFGVDMTSIRTHVLPPKRMRGRLSRGYKPRYKRVLFTIKPTNVLPWQKTKAEKAAKAATAKQTKRD